MPKYWHMALKSAFFVYTNYLCINQSTIVVCVYMCYVYVYVYIYIYIYIYIYVYVCICIRSQKHPFYYAPFVIMHLIL